MVISDKQIKHITIIPESLETAWTRWTTHDGLLTFFGLDNSINLTPDGMFEIYFLLDNPVGIRGSEGCKILSYLPNEMLSFTWNAPPHHPEARNSEHHTWVVLQFRSTSDNETEIRLTHLGWPDDEKWMAVFDYFNEAWRYVLRNHYDAAVYTNSLRS